MPAELHEYLPSDQSMSQSWRTSIEGWKRGITRRMRGSASASSSGRENDSAADVRNIEVREWWLSWSAVVVTLVLTLGIASLAFSMLGSHEMETENLQTRLAVRGLVGMVLLFDIYAIYQQLMIHRVRRQWMEREELFRLIGENAADMIAVVDSSGHRIYNSPSYQRILGFSPTELQSTTPFTQIHPDDARLVKEAATEAMKTGVGRRIEYRMRHKDGRWINLESTASTILNAKGDVDRLIIVNREIGERKRLEEQFRQAQKMEAIGRLSGGVAHDFNNLLGLIIGYSEILQEKIDASNPLRVSVDQILSAGKRASSLTRQLLAFSRQQVLEPKTLSLNEVVSDMHKMLRRLIGENIELTTTLDKELGKVRADQGQIEQVIMNLAVNARDAMPDGGRLNIATANVEMDEETAGSFPYPVVPGPYVLVKVSDNGSGMDTATQQRIFEPFFTTKEKGKGTGLGLSMVYGVVKQSGGYIDVSSELGKGTTFRIHLPRTQMAAEPEVPQSIEPMPLRGSGTILLVEDEKDLRNLTRTLLEAFGYIVIEAENGQEALQISSESPLQIDLLLTDIIMPGINGRVLAQKVHQSRPQTKVIYMSGYTGQTVGVQAVFEPGAVFLQKPFNRDALAKKVRDAFQSPVAVV